MVIILSKLLKAIHILAPLSSSGCFTKTTAHFTKRGEAATSSIWNVLCKGNMKSWTSKIKLFDAIVSTTSLYASQIWGLLHFKCPEKIQSKFIRRLLCVFCDVPGNILRLETGRPSLYFSLIKRAIMYWGKLLLMDDTRYAKKCFTALRNLPLSGNSKFNWALQMKSIFEQYGFSFLFEADYDVFSNYASPFLLSVLKNERQNDITKAFESEKYKYYTSLVNEVPLSAKYFYLRLPFQTLTILAQLRLNRNFVYFENNIYYFREERKLCEKPNSFSHFIMEYVPIRTLNAVRTRINNENRNWLEILNTDNLNSIIIFYNAFTTSLRLRKFIEKCFKNYLILQYNCIANQICIYEMVHTCKQNIILL